MFGGDPVIFGREGFQSAGLNGNELGALFGAENEVTAVIGSRLEDQGVAGPGVINSLLEVGLGGHKSDSGLLFLGATGGIGEQECRYDQDRDSSQGAEGSGKRV
jgi:hypothetical protein